MSNALSKAATARFEKLVRRLFALSVLFSSIETTANGVAQLDALNTLGTAAVYCLGAISLLLLLATIFDRRVDGLIWILGGFSLLLLLSWPALVAFPTSFNEGLQPWIWWLIGLATIGIGVVAIPFVAIAFLIATSVLWVVVDSSRFGGGDIWAAVQDSAYLLFFGGTVLGMIYVVREAVAKVDSANEQAIRNAIARASRDAVERERQRLDALIHDRVLNTLLLSSRAATAEERKAAADSASAAIMALKSAESEASMAPVRALGLFRALRSATLRLHPSASVEIGSAGNTEIPGEVASAITEALIQAVENANRHAKANNLTLKMSCTESGNIEVRLEDDGVGFSLDRIPRDRIGVRLSILARMQDAGGSGKILTEPGKGTEVLLRWEP